MVEICKKQETPGCTGCVVWEHVLGERLKFLPNTPEERFLIGEAELTNCQRFGQKMNISKREMTSKQLKEALSRLR